MEEYLVGFINKRPASDEAGKTLEPPEAFEAWFDSGRPFCKICKTFFERTPELKDHLLITHR